MSIAIDPDVITRHEAEGRYVGELDVADDVTVACSDCGNTDLSAEMVAQGDGEFLCVACDHENFREWQDAMNERWQRR